MRRDSVQPAFLKGDRIDDPLFTQRLEHIRDICNSVRVVSGPGVTHTNDEVIIATQVPVGQLATQASGVIPVLTTQVGGSQGGQTWRATWTYNFSNALTGALCGTGATPWWPRPNGRFTPGTAGFAFQQTGLAGTAFVLMLTSEIPLTGTCSPP